MVQLALPVNWCDQYTAGGHCPAAREGLWRRRLKEGAERSREVLKAVCLLSY